MQSNKTLSFVCALLALLIGAHGSLALAQQGPKVRFSNWEFDPMPLLQKVEQTADKLVYKLDKSVPGAGGTVTFQAGQPLKGTLAARLDTEWKRLTAGRKFANTEPDDDTALADGTKVLRRSAMTANGGFFSVTAFAAPNGVNLMLMEAADEMATQMLAGMSFGFFAMVKLHPVGGPTALAKAGTPATAKPAETPQEEMARLNREMMQNPIPGMPGSSTAQHAAGAGGLQAPTVKPMPQTEKTTRDTDRITVPRRDAARIKMVPSTPPSAKALADFLRRTEPQVRQKLPQNVQAGCDALYKDARKRGLNATAIGNIAGGLWMMGGPTAALCLLGKTVVDTPANVNNLNNYAALLTMAGGQHLALPILMKLEQDFPGNSTVLNNIAQAWFGLGDVEKAEAYINKALARFPRHSQANFTKSVVSEHKGDKRGATEAMRKSMAQGYSEEKEAQLGRMGHKLRADDYTWDVPRKEEPLKLHKFLQLVPPYYKKAAEAPRASAEWSAFRAALHAASESLEAQYAAMESAVQKEWYQYFSELVSGRRRMSPMQTKFTLKYVTHGRLPEDLINQTKRWKTDAEAAARKVNQLREQMNAVLRKPNVDCGAQQSAVTAFMKQANTIWEDLQSEPKLKEKVRWIEEWAHLLLYYNDPGDVTYQSYLIGLKTQFLAMLQGLQHEHPIVTDCGSPTVSSSLRGPLPLFEDLHCEKHISLTVPVLGSIEVNCHYMSTNFSIAGFSASIKENVITGEFEQATVELGLVSEDASKKLSDGIAPITAEAGVEAAGFVEFDKNGISDVGIKAGVSAGMKLDGVPGAGVGAGVKTVISVNAGVGVKGTGMLSGLSSQTGW